MVSNRIFHILRVAVMFLSFGFIFPHAMTEDEDVGKCDAGKRTRIKEQ